MKYTSEIFQRLSRGQFISSNSIDAETRAIYNDIEENQQEYEDYFSQIDFQLSSGDGFYYFSRKEAKHWWVNGFQLSKNLYSADELTLKFTIEMKDEEMLDAFCKSVDNNIRGDVSYTVSGLKVSLVW